MPGIVELTLEPTRALVQQPIIINVTLKNTGRDALKSVNPLNKSGIPTFLLTELASGEVTRLVIPLQAETKHDETNVRPGGSLNHEFPLSSLVRDIGPGAYELRAQHSWDGGGATSPAVRFEVLPGVPEAGRIVSAYGGAGPLYFALWVNTVEGAKRRRELWLSTIATSHKPKVENSVFLKEHTPPGCPVLSIPPGVAPAAQWVVWTSDGKLWYFAHKQGMVSETSSLALESPAAMLFSPVLLNPAEKGRILPGPDVLLGEPKPGGEDCNLRILRLSMSQPARTMDLKPLPPGGMPEWLDTAALPSGMRYTYVAQSHDGQTSLHQLSWSYARPDGIWKQLATWPGHCIAAAQWLCDGNRVVGVLLLRAGELKRHDYRFQYWSLTEKGVFEAGRSVPFIGADRFDIARALVSINVGGDAHALIATGQTEQEWQYVTADGALHDLPPDARPFALPAAVLYRRMEDPTIMFSRPPLGFEFAKPD